MKKADFLTSRLLPVKSPEAILSPKSAIATQNCSIISKQRSSSKRLLISPKTLPEARKRFAKKVHRANLSYQDKK